MQLGMASHKLRVKNLQKTNSGDMIRARKTLLCVPLHAGLRYALYLQIRDILPGSHDSKRHLRVCSKVRVRAVCVCVYLVGWVGEGRLQDDGWG